MHGRRMFKQVCLRIVFLVPWSFLPVHADAQGVVGWDSVPAILARIKPPQFPGPRLSSHRLRRSRRRQDRLQAGLRQGDRRLQRGGRRARRRAGRRLVRARADPFEVGRQSARRRGRHRPLQHRSGRLSARRAHPLRRQRGDELLAAHLRHRTPRTSRSPARARSTARPGRNTGGPGRASRQRPESGQRSQRCGKWARTTCRPPSASSAPATTCGRTSSSRTAAATCSSKASRSPTRRCGSSTPCSAKTSPSAASRSKATARTTTAAIPNRAATCSSKTARSTRATTASPSRSGRNADGRRIGVPSENIVVRGCTMKDGHGGVVLGSEMSGGIRNVFVEDCAMDSPNLDRAIRLKSNSHARRLPRKPVRPQRPSRPGKGGRRPHQSAVRQGPRRALPHRPQHPHRERHLRTKAAGRSISSASKTRRSKTS